ASTVVNACMTDRKTHSMRFALPLGTTAPPRFDRANVSSVRCGDGKPWRLEEADYRAMTARLILGNIEWGDRSCAGLSDLPLRVEDGLDQQLAPAQDAKHLANARSHRGEPFNLIFRRISAQARLRSLARNPSHVRLSAVT